ncbi:LysM peptidoglycan-binding domain-containing protein [Ruania halotolerans]|uniref:LysM peptidoglycan-binding domain-containing protein n=1 Tax=Ruania halotolerans TaxID=2897773 RepID=UPI001E3810BC|nr:LysM peptidoglycan-binding domain-containing protein [Ruania halotolerans]UFU05145.1 LysM peptidoglycan-binding domain-containing protein [Ruania halotolerans]
MSALALPVPEFRPSPVRRRHLVAVPDTVPDVPGRPAASDPTVQPAPAPGAAVASVMRPLRLTARGRVVLSVLALLAAVLVGSLVGITFPANEAPPAEVGVVTVAAGESLWVIASEVAEPGQDVRVVIDQIMALNGLSGATVHAGQQLTVPAGS